MKSMTSTEESTTHSREVNDHSSCDGYIGSYDGPHLTAASMSNSENSNEEVMQIINNTCTDKTDTFKPVKMITVCNLSVKALVVIKCYELCYDTLSHCGYALSFIGYKCVCDFC
ncbi:unnamed protein product [Parnassius apollo]|uniref:(apollo) hypothetical protein n=1 Tax=Parnassius apollo TaxID=110799 RepID=A0A8S3XE07_PARAO|nr:unnamed protein product [Parnassius apollo]